MEISTEINPVFKKGHFRQIDHCLVVDVSFWYFGGFIKLIGKIKFN